MVEVLAENEVARLVDDGYYYILEDKTQLRRPVVVQRRTETYKTFYVDFGTTESGRWVAIRYYFPKDQFELEIIMRAFETLTRGRRAEIEKLRELYAYGEESP